MLAEAKVDRAALVAEMQELRSGRDEEHAATLRQHVVEAEAELKSARIALERFEGQHASEAIKAGNRCEEIKRLLRESASPEIDAAIGDCNERITRAQTQRRIAFSATTVVGNATAVDGYILACREAIKQLNRLRTSEDDSTRAIKAILKTIPPAHFPETTSPRKQQ